MGLDARIGSQFLKAGLGYGGFFPEGRAGFHPLVRSVGVDFDILKATERVNKQRSTAILKKFARLYGW